MMSLTLYNRVLGRGTAAAALALAIAACDEPGTPPAHAPTEPGVALARGGAGDNNGRILFVSNRDDPNLEVYSMNPDGSGVTRLTYIPSLEEYPVLSPDGKRIAFASNLDEPDGSEIYVMNADGTGITRLTFSTGFDIQPVWSKDGKRIAFASTRDAVDPLSSVFVTQEIYVMDADGSNATRLTNRPGGDYSPSWSPDGKRIAFASDRAGTGTNDVYVMNADGSQVSRITTVEALDVISLSWAARGKQIAFSTGQVYVVNDDGTQLTKLTQGPALNELPSWLDGGRKIAFSSTRDINAEVYSMNADGTGVTRLTIHPASDLFPSAQR